MRAAKARTGEELERAFKAALELVTESDCFGWFTHRGYPVTSNCNQVKCGQNTQTQFSSTHLFSGSAFGFDVDSRLSCLILPKTFNPIKGQSVVQWHSVETSFHSPQSVTLGLMLPPPLPGHHEGGFSFGGVHFGGHGGSCSLA